MKRIFFFVIVLFTVAIYSSAVSVGDMKLLENRYPRKELDELKDVLSEKEWNNFVESELKDMKGETFQGDNQSSVENLPPEPKEVPVVKVRMDDLKVPDGKEVILGVYTVKKGDYLAKIATRNYKNKDFWKLIYSYNNYIKDSHWIFPGDKIILPLIVNKLPEVPEKEEAPEEVDNRNYGNFIAPEEFEFDGVIADFKVQKAMHVQGDYAFVDIGKSDGIRESQRLNIYRVNRYIVHPYTGEPLGELVEKIGEIMVTSDVEEATATTRILYSDRSIETGDMLLAIK